MCFPLRPEKMRVYNGSRGGNFFFRFFLILVENIQNSKRRSKKKKFVFLFRTFWEKKLSHFIDFVDFTLKKGVFSSYPPPSIFQNKNFEIISTVRNFVFNDQVETMNV